VTAQRGAARPGVRARFLAAASIAAVVLTVLTGCAAGQRAATSEETPVLDAVDANVGSIYLRALTVTTPKFGQYPIGSNAPVQLLIVNGGPDDQLLSVSAGNLASSVALFPNAGAAASAPAAPAPASATPTSTTPASGGASTSPSPTPSPSISGSLGSIDLPSGETTQIGLDPSQPAISLMGLKEALWPSMSIQLTFTFAHAGQVQVWVSVQLTQGPVTAPTLATENTDVDQ
jgi:hypothetical protein